MRHGLPLLSFLGLLALVPGCRGVPFAGPRLLQRMTPSQERALGLDAYRDLLRRTHVVRGTAAAQLVEDVGRRIAAASGESYDWEFALLDDDATANAFCLPGGKVAVYSGLLSLTRNADGLAAVLGHEVAHAAAHHAAERVSRQLVEAGVIDLAGASMESRDPLARAAILKGLGLGVEVGALLPYSREHEVEADAIGVRYMVRAGYNPNEAVSLWERMAEREGPSGPVFLSTHPAPRERAERIARLIPKVLAEERAPRR